MIDDIIYDVIAVIIACIMVFGNRKVRLLSLFIDQWKVFRNAQKNKTSLWDIICFIVAPVILALVVVDKKGFVIDNSLAQVLTTVFSFVFTILFGFASILIGRVEKGSEIERQVIQETFVSIMTTNCLSLVVSVAAILVLSTKSATAHQWLSRVILAVAFMIIMLLLLVSKRVYNIYVNAMNE